ncbi:MAG: EamA family transporter, partial [Anaerolineales bacterium]
MSFLAIGLVLCSTFLHAGWNLMVRDQRHSEVFTRTLLCIFVIGLGPALAAEVWGTPIIPMAAGYLIVAGVFQAIYYLGLKFGYRSGEFTVVYPLARSVPVMALALLDMLLGRTPSWLGWLGILLVSLGCLLVPLRSWRELRPANYLNHGVGWALVTAIGVVGYSLTD